MLLLDLLITAYQGILLVYLIKRQFVQRSHSILFEIASVSAFVLFFSVIQYLNVPIPEALVVIIPILYMKATSHERFMVCIFWAILDIFLLLGTLTLVSGMFDMQIAMNGNVLAASGETRIIYYFVGTAALTAVMNIAARFSKTTHVISRTETVLFILMQIGRAHV